MQESELSLINIAKSGDVTSFEELVSPYQRRLFRFILLMTGNPADAEDALQETILHAFQFLHQFRGDCTFSTWIHRIAVTTTRNWLRSQSRKSSARFLDQAWRLIQPEESTPESAILASEELIALRQALAALPQHYREALVLRHYQELSYEQIATILQIPIGTVRSRIAQGKKLMVRSLHSLGLSALLPEDCIL